MKPNETIWQGDRVHVKTAGYEATGTLVSVFTKRDGKMRVVVEYDQPAGLLHIHNPDQCTKIEDGGDDEGD